MGRAYSFRKTITYTRKTTGAGCSANMLFAKEAMMLNAMGKAISMNGLTRGRVAIRRGAACGSLANFAPPELSDCPRHTCCTSRITGARDDAAVLLHVAVRPTRILAKPARIGVRASVKARQHRDKRPGLLSNHARGTVPSLLLSLNLFNHCV